MFKLLLVSHYWHHGNDAPVSVMLPLFKMYADINANGKVNVRHVQKLKDIKKKILNCGWKKLLVVENVNAYVYNILKKGQL